jgi:hypothetical protein
MATRSGARIIAICGTRLLLKMVNVLYVIPSSSSRQAITVKIMHANAKRMEALRVDGTNASTAATRAQVPDMTHAMSKRGAMAVINIIKRVCRARLTLSGYRDEDSAQCEL